MNNVKPIVALFDLDGVVIDTEPQYTIFWDSMGLKYLDKEDFGKDIKGQTLPRIFSEYFSGLSQYHLAITKALDEFEANMKMPYVPGILSFVEELSKNGVRTAIVTSSNEPKMKSVYINHPELKTIFDKILTAEMFTRSKPYPDPYLLGAKVFDSVSENCFVFEDSFNGLKSGRAANMKVIGLSTTNKADDIAEYSDIVISDYLDFTYQKMLEV